MDDAYAWVSTREAASRLGISPSTVERLVRRGKLVAERIERPGGTRLLIRLDRPQEPPQATSDDVVTPEPLAVSEPPQVASDATMRALSIMEAVLLANAESLERQAETIGTLRERIGQAEAEATRLRARADQERARLLAMADDLGATRAARLIAQAHRDQLSRQCDALKAELERARRPWWRWWR